MVLYLGTHELVWLKKLQIQLDQYLCQKIYILSPNLIVMFAFSTPHCARGDYCCDQHLCARHDVRESYFSFACHVLRRLHLSALLETGEHYGQECLIRMSQSQSLKLCVPIYSHLVGCHNLVSMRRGYTTRGVGMRQRHRDLGEQCSQLSQRRCIN